MAIVGVVTAAALLAACDSPEPGRELPKKAEPARVAHAPGPEPARDTRPLILAFGDSLTAGLGVDPDQNYPSKLQARLDAAGYRYRVVNEGASGDTTSQGVNRLGPVLELRPAIAIVELGANDGLRGIPVEETRKNLEEIITRFQQTGAKVVLAGMMVPPNYGEAYTNPFRATFPDLARKHQAALVPFFLEGVAGRPDLNQEDGLHPTASGYSVVTDNVWRVLRPLLRR